MLKIQSAGFRAKSTFHLALVLEVFLLRKYVVVGRGGGEKQEQLWRKVKGI